MRADLGFILIGAGLIGAYLVLAGKFPPASTSTAASTANYTPPASGTANVPISLVAYGSGGMSLQSRINQFGHAIALQKADRHASRGGF